MYDLSDKTVIITGGGSGIGLGIARAFSKAGANLVLTGRTHSKLDNAKEELSGRGGDVFIITADGSKEEDVKAVIDAAIRKFGRIDVIINNAQNSASGVLLKDHTEADFDRAIYSGLYATFYYMKHSYEALKEAKVELLTLPLVQVSQENRANLAMLQQKKAFEVLVVLRQQSGEPMALQ